MTPAPWVIISWDLQGLACERCHAAEDGDAYIVSEAKFAKQAEAFNALHARCLPWDDLGDIFRDMARRGAFSGDNVEATAGFLVGIVSGFCKYHTKRELGQK